LGFRYAESLAQAAGGRVVDREDVFDEPQEERDAVPFLIDALGRSSAANNLIKLRPFRQHRLAREQEKRAMKSGLAGHQERGALGRQRIAPLTVLGEKLQAHKGIQYRA